MTKIYKFRNENKGLGATDILVAVVVAAILGIIIYNIHLKVKSSREDKYANVYLSKNSELALKAISEDLVNSMVYAAGCKNLGLLKPFYGGLDSSDKITILRGSPFSMETLKEDMVQSTSDVKLNLGASFQSNQKLAICNEETIEWFVVDRMSHNEKTGTSTIIPKSREDGTYINTKFERGSTVGVFEKVIYFVKEDEKGNTALYRQVLNEDETLVAPDIESIKFEYTTDESTVPVVDPVFPKRIIGVKITVVAKSKEEDPHFLQGRHSLTGMHDGYKRLNISTYVPFKPLELDRIESVTYRIAKNRETGGDIPVLVNNKRKEEGPKQEIIENTAEDEDFL